MHATPLPTQDDREKLKDDFLAEAGWHGAQRTLLAGDASFRKYDRVHHKGTQAVLMDAPPPVEDVRPFLRIADWLVEAGFSAPRILARDEANGFLLLEDLGDDSYTKLLQREPARESELYREAGALMAELHQATMSLPAEILPYDAEKMHQEADLLVDWYLRAVRGPEAAAEAMPGWRAAWAQLFAQLPSLPPVLVLRDYHADNLMWVPTRDGTGRVGLLDFQDALIGSPAYDLVSFLEDARRDVAPETVDAVLAEYIAQSGVDGALLRLHYAVLGAQRNAKILGIFLRLTLRDGKPHYLNYLPRVWSHFRHDVKHPALQAIAAWTERWLPTPYQTVPPLEELKRRFQGAAA